MMEDNNESSRRNVVRQLEKYMGCILYKDAHTLTNQRCSDSCLESNQPENVPTLSDFTNKERDSEPAQLHYSLPPLLIV